MGYTCKQIQERIKKRKQRNQIDYQIVGMRKLEYTYNATADTYQPMNKGGHGKIGFRFKNGAKQISIPALAGHTFDLPSGFFLVEAQRAPSWDKAGAYLPPCSGGKGNDYYVLLKAVKVSNDKVTEELAEIEIKMGKY